MELLLATFVDTANGFTDSKPSELFTILPIDIATASGTIVGAKLLLLIVFLFILLFVVGKLYSIVSLVSTINRNYHSINLNDSS